MKKAAMISNNEDRKRTPDLCKAVIQALIRAQLYSLEYVDEYVEKLGSEPLQYRLTWMHDLLRGVLYFNV